MKCPKCHREVANNYKFCPSCRTPLTQFPEPSPQDLEQKTIQEKPLSNTDISLKVIKNKLVWDIIPGEIAHRLDNNDFNQFQGVSGIIIPEGVTAVIYIDGNLKASVGSGIYNFVSDETINEILEEKISNNKSLYGISRTIIKGITHLICGKKVKDTLSDNSIEKKHQSIVDIIDSLRDNSIINVYLKVDRPFTLLFGIQHSQDKKSYEFKPFVIQTKHLDFKIGLSLLLEISDFKKVISTMLTTQKVILLQDVQRMIEAYIPAILQDELHDKTEDQLHTKELHDKIAFRLDALSSYIPGFRIINLGKLTYDNYELNRFHQIAKYLYCTEKELDFLCRTNDFKNRLADIQNQQKIIEAKNSLEIKKALDEINKDELLQKAEIEQFHLLLSRQRTIRQATNELEQNKALAEINHAKLLNDDEQEELIASLNFKKFDRNNIYEMMMQQRIATAKKHQLEIETELSGLEIQKEADLDDIRFEVEKRSTNHEIERYDIAEIIYGKQYLIQKKELERKIDLDRLIRREDYQIQLEKAEMENELIRKNIETRKDVDDYEYEKNLRNVSFGDERKIKEAQIELEIEKERAEFEHKKALDEIDIENNKEIKNLNLLKQKREDSLNALAKLAEIKEKKKVLEHNLEMEKERLAKEEREHQETLKHDENMTEKKYIHEENLSKIEAEKEYSAEKMFVSKMDALNNNKTAEIYASRFSSAKDLEAMQKAQEKIDREKELIEAERKALYEKAERSSEERVRKMEEMAMNMFGMAERTMSNNSSMVKEVLGARDGHERENFDRLERIATHRTDELQTYSSQRLNDLNVAKEEYRDQMKHEQKRHDEHQDRALNYTTKVNRTETIHKKISEPERCVSYYVEGMGNVPFTLEQIQSFVKNGIINKRTVISCNNQKMFAEDFKELLTAFEECDFIICPHCKTKVTEKDSKFCPECGEDL